MTMNKTLKHVLLLSLIVVNAIPVLAQETKQQYWPKIIPLEQITITIYKPEIESFNHNKIEVRAAFNIYDRTRLPIFGALWFSAMVHIDKSAKTVLYDNITMVNADFPDITEAKKKEFRELLKSVIPTWQFNASLDNLTIAVKNANTSEQSSNSLNNSPPNIFYEQVNTELVFIDGDPILKEIEGSKLYKYVVNTPYFIILSTSDNYFYLQTGAWWFRTDNIYGDWSPIAAPPQSIAALAIKSQEVNLQKNNELITNSSTRPQLYVVLHQAALIQTNGEAEFTNIQGTSLSYASNTENDLLKDNKTGLFYVRLSGRWYKSTSLNRGAWSFVPPDSLPVYFKKIPGSSTRGHLRISIPGTPEAMSAALDNGIPQTAIVDRVHAKIMVEYDGEPLFESIEGTKLEYAVNTNLSIIKTAKNQFYAVDEAIWFTSNSPTENWTVSTMVPQEVMSIPPSSPVYNIKYVYIYDYSDEYVYVGYTGGYTGTFLYQGCLFYGTGYQYKPWYKSKYYPRPLTYAFGVNRTGGNSNIRVTVGIGFGYGYPGFYSPYGYGYGGYGSYSTATINGGYELKQGYERKALDPSNIYNNRTQGIVSTQQVRRNNPYEILPANQQGTDGRHIPPTNLYSDKSGNIYKQHDDGSWHKRTDGVWVKVKGKPAF